MMLDLVQNSPGEVKIAPIIIVGEKNIFFCKRIEPLAVRKNLPT